MHIVVNGSDRDVEAGSTVADLVGQFELEPKQVAVEVNCELVPRSAFGETRLRDEDRVEIVTLVGGG